MKMTKHARARQRQRGLSDFTISVILNHGKAIKAPGNATRVSFNNKEYQQVVSNLKKTLQLLDKAKGGELIISKDRIITVYKKARRGGYGKQSRDNA